MNKLTKFLYRLTLLALLLPAQGYSATQSFQQVIGNATGLQSGEYLYREVHCGAKNELASEVLYLSRDKTLIAHKKLNYESGSTTPSFIQTNVLNQEKIDVSFDQKAIVMSMIAADGKQTSRQYQVSRIDKDPIVIDAGFDTFIQQNWKELVSGKTKVFQFPLVSRSTLISLRVKSAVCQYQTETDQCFALEPANWFFRMLASPIELGYDSSLIRLNRYRGLSNINDENGDGLVVDIKYLYQSQEIACEI